MFSFMHRLCSNIVVSPAGGQSVSFDCFSFVQTMTQSEVSTAKTVAAKQNRIWTGIMKKKIRIVTPFTSGIYQFE